MIRGKVMLEPRYRGRASSLTITLTGVVAWTPVEIDARQLGEHSVFATVHWNAVNADDEVLRDTVTSYQLLATPHR